MSEEFIQVTVRIDPGEQDEGGFVAVCQDLGIASQGERIDEALENIQEAIEELISGLFELGDLGSFLKEHGVDIYSEPPDKSTITVNRGEVVSALVASLGRAPAFV